MKKIIRLTESDIRRLVKKSVNKILREGEFDDDYIDGDGFVRSISKYVENPVDLNNYDPSDDEIMDAMGDFNFDDFDMMESSKRNKKVLKEYMFDNPLNQTDLDDEPIDDEEGLTPELGMEDKYDRFDDAPEYDDYSGLDDNIEGFNSPYTGLFGYNGDDRDFLDNASYDSEDFVMRNGDLRDDFKYGKIMNHMESRIRSGRRVNEITGFPANRNWKNDKAEKKTNPDDIKGVKKNWGKGKRDGDWYESKNIIGRALRESINNILKKKINEGLKGTDPDNVVPEDVARKLGFKPEYSDGKNGLEIWGKQVNPMSAKKYLSYLGISHFTTSNVNGKIRITVKPNPKSMVDKTHPRQIGDYVSTEYGDNMGEIFHNPKNGHVKRLNNRGEFK